MQASRAPWWFYVLAVSFLLSFPLMLYNSVWGPGDSGIDFAPVSGHLIVKEVRLDKPAGRAGMRAGDRILNVDGIPMRGVFDYWLASLDFEAGRPIAVVVERQGKPAELMMTLPPGSPGGLGWDEWETLATAIVTFVLALIIGVRRPREPAARICAWFMASFALIVRRGLQLGHLDFNSDSKAKTWEPTIEEDLQTGKEYLRFSG